jgi:hypothetical protein
MPSITVQLLLEPHVREKCAVVDQEPRPNQARVFLGALRGDWKPAVSSVKPRAVKRNIALVEESLRTTTDEGWKKGRAQVAEMTSSLQRQGLGEEASWDPAPEQACELTKNAPAC